MNTVRQGGETGHLFRLIGKKCLPKKSQKELGTLINKSFGVIT